MHILILEDDPFYQRKIREISEDYGLVTITADPYQAQDYLNNTKVDLFIGDIELNHELSGLDIAKIAKKKNVQTFILTSLDDDEFIERAYQAGCKHYFLKRNLKQALKTYLEELQCKASIDYEQLFNTKFITSDLNLIGSIKDLLDGSIKDRTVLITGETGTGKTELAKVIHQSIHNKEKPFIHLNCSEITESLLESELFGHDKGSFTGAIQNKIGMLALADQGTLFLDEIGSMPTSMQQKLLRVLEEKSFYPVGSSKLTSTSFTLISATCDDLPRLMNEKKFRKDLFLELAA